MSQSDFSAESGNTLLKTIQRDFPIVSRPFEQIGGEFGFSERAVIDAITNYKTDGFIRALGPVFEPRRLGYVSTLVAAQVDMDRIAEIAAAILDIHEITHNYVRENDWNLWFTITARNADILENLVKWAEKFPGVTQVMSLPVTQVFKIDAVWGIEAKDTAPVQPDTEPTELDADDRRLIKTLQHEFPILERPFKLIAGSLGLSEDDVLETISGWVADGTIRRFGARLNHHKAGYTENTLVAWRGRDVVQWGERFARLDAISHCYLREPGKDWPYELYTMVHATSARDLQKTIRHMNEIAVGSQMVKLKTLYELKKTAMKYFVEE